MVTLVFNYEFLQKKKQKKTKRSLILAVDFKEFSNLLSVSTMTFNEFCIIL